MIITIAQFLTKIPQPIYCERHGAGLFAEPLNAMTNTGFFLAAYGIYRLIKKNNLSDWEYYALCILAVFIGSGSFLWHTARATCTLLLDALPVFMFLGLVFYLLFRILFTRIVPALVGFMLLAAIEIAFSALSEEVLNGSLKYIINALAFGFLMVRINRRYGRYFTIQALLILCLYTLAIVSRTIDKAVCPYLPIGTHFIWHGINALNIYLVVRFLITMRNSDRKPGSYFSPG